MGRGGVWWGGVECGEVEWGGVECGEVEWGGVEWGEVEWGGVYLCYHWCRFGGHTGIAGNILSHLTCYFSECKCIILHTFHFVCFL